MTRYSKQQRPLTIAVASGKGGTGKTTIASNLAMLLAREGTDTVYADCDVEAPNGHLFLKPAIPDSRQSVMHYPVIDEDRCTGCGKCQEICQYNAIAVVGGAPMVFRDLCHDCGGCLYVCPVQAVSEAERVIGVVETGTAGPLAFIQGRLDIGQVMSPPLIRDVKRSIPAAAVAIIDAPPGTSCPVMTALSGADFALLVTEPTPFGLHDLKLAVDAVRLLGIPTGVVINRHDLGPSETDTFLASRGIPVLARISDDTAIARAYSEGALIIDALPEYRGLFQKLADTLLNEMHW